MNNMDNNNVHPHNIIFLDIDGVLLIDSDGKKNSNKFMAERAFINEKIPEDVLETLYLYDVGAVLNFNKGAVARLHTLIEKTDAKIVVSSDWRLGKTVEKLKWLLSLHDLDKYIIDKTGEEKNAFDRKANIRAWLKANQSLVKNFVIIDDLWFNGLDRKFPDNFVLTQTHFTEEDLEKALAILLRKPVKISAVCEKDNDA